MLKEEDNSTQHFLEQCQSLMQECDLLPLVGSSQSLGDDQELFSSRLMEKFETLLTRVIDTVLSKEGSCQEIQRLAPDFRCLIECLFNFFLDNASLFSSKNLNIFESFLKFYFIRSNYKYSKHFLQYLNQRLTPFLTGKYNSFPDKLEIKNKEFAALLRSFYILTSFNSFSEYKNHFLTTLGFSGFFVKNKYLNSIDHHDKSFLANRSLLLNLHLKNDFSILLQFCPCSQVPKEISQQLICFQNQNNQIHPFWGWSIEICNDKLYFILHKPGEPGTNSVQTERHMLMTFPNRLVFFDSWNTLIISCQNSFKRKISEVTISLNNRVKILKLAIDRETLFHSFDLVQNNLPTTLLRPALSTYHLLNDLLICKNFQGKTYQCLVFKEQLKASEIDALGSILRSVDEVNVLDSHLKIRTWIRKHHLMSKIALDFNAFDLRHQHISFAKKFSEYCDNLIFSSTPDLSPIEESQTQVQFLDSSSLNPVIFVPVKAINPLESLQDLAKSASNQLFPFKFNFEFFSTDPYQFDFSLFQQNFNLPFLLCLKPVSQFNNIPLRNSLYITWSKTIANFYSKPRLASTLSTNQIETRINQLLGTLLFCCFTSELNFFPPKICDVYLDILNSIELSVSVHLLNKLFLNRVFLFKLSETVADMNYFISKLTIWLVKYKKIRELVNWPQVFENFIFFLAISDFADEPLDSPHFQLSCHLATIILLFFPCNKAVNQSLLIFLKDLKLDCHFTPIWRAHSEFSSTKNWSPEHLMEAMNLLKKNAFSPSKNLFIKLDLKLLLYQLNSPLLIKSSHKTALLLDILFLLFEHHSVNSSSELLTSTLLSLLYDYKNNSAKIVIRCFALLLKDKQTLKVVPPSLFNLRKFNFSSMPMVAPNQSLLNFLRDSSYKILFSDSLLEYLFSLFFDNYSLSGFFDHERLMISDDQTFKIFFSLARLFEPSALEKSLQIFSILLKHSQQSHALTLFNSTSIFVSLLDLLYRFTPLFRDEDDLKDKAYFFLKQRDSSLASRLELSRKGNLHKILLYFEGHKTNWETFFHDASPPNAVFDLTLRLIKLILDCNRSINPCAIQLSQLVLVTHVYFSRFRAFPLALNVLPVFFDQFNLLLPILKNKEPLFFCLFVLQSVLLPVDLSFFSSPKHFHPSWLKLLSLLQHWLSCNNSILLSHFPLHNPENLLKKNRFKFLSSDRRFPVLPSLLTSKADFCFLDFIPGNNDQNFSANPESKETHIESIFLMSKCLINVAQKLTSSIKTIKQLILPSDSEVKLKVDVHLMGLLTSLAKHLEVLLLISRHSFFKRKSNRLQHLLPRVIAVMSKPQDHWKLTQNLLLRPFLLLSDPSIDSFKSLLKASEDTATPAFPVYLQGPGTFKDVQLLTRVTNRRNFDFLDEAPVQPDLTKSSTDFLGNEWGLNFEHMMAPSERIISREQAPVKPDIKSKEGFFSLLAKNFKKQSKELKLHWKKNSFLQDLAQEIHKITNRDIHSFEKKTILIKIFGSLISFFSDTKSEKSASTSNEKLQVDRFLSPETLFSSFSADLSHEILGFIPLSPSDSSRSPSKFTSQPSPDLKNSAKSKGFYKFEDKDSRTRSQQSMNHYQQALGTLLFSFQRNLVCNFKGHYKIVKKCFSIKGQYSLFGAQRNLLKNLIIRSMNLTFVGRTKEGSPAEQPPPKKARSSSFIDPSQSSLTDVNLLRTSSVDESPRAPTKMVFPLVKQDKTTICSFQRPFVKVKPDFVKSRGMEFFPYFELLSKKGREGLSQKFVQHFAIIKRINSYLKAFFEMEKFSDGSESVSLGKKQKQNRRNLPTPQKLPFSSVLYHAKFRNLSFFSCYIVYPFYSMPAIIIIEGNRFTVVLSDLLQKRKPHLELKQVTFKLTKGMSRSYLISNIYKILEYKFIHSSNAIQILFQDNRSAILHFAKKETLQEFLKKLAHKRSWLKSKIPSCKDDLKRQNLKSLWAYNNSISNFSFLSFLNLLGARSLDDFSQYPVFPLVISGIENQSVQFRDLSLPVGMIGDESKVEMLSQKFVKSDNFHDIPPYFYGSHYSSPATTFHFLLRLKPFEKGAKTIQNGRFDLPDRLFHSFANVLDNIQKETSDVREFPPELYYQPLFLLNLNNLDFGINQSGNRVDHVLTPEILGECPFKFVYSLRKELESPRVSRSLAKWVDLIFGVHQQGDSGIAKNNIFFYLTYQESEKSLLNASEKDTEALETQVFHFGQVPLQLTQSSWPEKRFLDLSIVSPNFTKKYFVKKVFGEKLTGLTSTCEFCYEKIEVNQDAPETTPREKVALCDTCHLCRDCSFNKEFPAELAEQCHFCFENQEKEFAGWDTTGAPHENAILLIKEESFMDLNRKYISKISIIRPFRVDFYTFILFKSEKQVNLEEEKVLASFEDKARDTQNPSGSEDPALKRSELNGSLNSSEKFVKLQKASPFELNLNKSLSLEKLQFEMKNWDLVGIPGGLWSLKQSFDLFKDKLLIGGCPRGFFRMFSIRKSKCQLTTKLHEYCIDKVIVAISGIIMTKDVSGIIKISVMEERYAKPHLNNLLCIYHTFDEPICFLNFPPDQSQLFFYVIPSSLHFQFKVFDSLNNAKLLMDVDIPRERQTVSSARLAPAIESAKLEFIDLSFGFLNSIVSVQSLEHSNQYFLSTFSFEGVPLTQFTLALQDDNSLHGFQLFKDCFFKDYLVAISQKGDIYFFDLPFVENVKKISSKVSLRPQKMAVIGQAKAMIISDSEGLLHFYTVLPSQSRT